jgi:Tfp pilus assembly protein PilN
LSFKKITTVFFSENTKGIKQFRFPRFLLLFFLLLLICCATMLVWIIRDYLSIRPQMVRFALLQKENEDQKRQFIHLAERIIQMTQKVDEIQALDRQLKHMVDPERSEGDIEVQGVGLSVPNPFPPDYSVAKTHPGLVRLMHLSLDQLNHKIAAIKQGENKFDKVIENLRVRLASIPSIWPTRGWLSSHFGYRISPFTGKKEFHGGIDIPTRMEATVIAPGDGIVSSSRRERIAGNVLHIDHGHGLVTRYAHLQKTLVKKGQFIKRGETIALVGNTGRSTGPHLHYGVYLNGMPVNPLDYILN